MPQDDVTRRLAAVLSDRELLADVLRDVDVRGGEAPRANIKVHLRGLDEFDGGKPVDPRDPLAAAARRITPQAKRDLAAVEGPLFAWLEESKDHPAMFAAAPAQVVRSLKEVDPQVRQRVAGALQRSGGPLTRMPGIVIDELTVDTSTAGPPPVLPLDSVTKGSTAADAVFELALEQLARVLDGAMVPAVRQRASRLAFETLVNGQTQKGVLSFLLEDVRDPRLSLDANAPTNTLVVTIGFPEATIELGTGPLAGGGVTNLGGVEVTARLLLGDEPRADGGGTKIVLSLVPGSVTVTLNDPTGLGSLPQQLWAGAAAEAAQQLAPFYAFAAPLTFDNSVCGIGARGVTSRFRDAARDMNMVPTTSPSLALFIALREATTLPAPTDATPSLVPIGADGHMLLNNSLVLELACCLLSESDAWSGLPASPTESDATCCKWKNVSNISIGDQSFDELELLEVCVDDGLRMKVVIKDSGFGWRARVEVNTTVNLRVEGGVLLVDTNKTVDVDIDAAWYLVLVSILAMIGGAILVVIGFCGGGPVVGGVGGGLFVLGLGLWALGHLLAPDIRVPTNFDDAMLDLLPGGLRDHLGALDFLTAAAWDDIALAGYMTVPNEPPLVAGDEIRLAPGSGLDLDTGEIISAADLPRRLDVDLVLHPSIRDTGVEFRSVYSELARGVPSGVSAGAVARRLPGGVGTGADVGIRRTLAAFGSSRLVALAGRPYPTIGESDLRSVVFPATATYIGVPGNGSSPEGVAATVFAARSSAGRLAKGVVWTDAVGATWLRYRTYDTPLLLQVAGNHSVQRFGKDGVTDILTILNARYGVVRGGVWADGRPLTFEWYWQGTRVEGVATIDGGARMTVVDDRCTIDTQQGVDLRGALCVVARDAAGLAMTACSNVLHIGRIPKPPDIDPEIPGGGLPGRPGSGIPGGPGGPGSPA